MDQLETHETKIKPVVQIKDAAIAPYFGHKKVLWGIPENHPRSHLNGKDIHSSEILSVQGDRVETKNTVYEVVSWHKSHKDNE